MLQFYRDDLARLDAAGRLRGLRPRMGAEFASNDYLGLSASARMREAMAAALARGVAIGSGGSRLLRGNDPEHEALEVEAAAHFGSAAALFFANGYAANVAAFATLPQPGDLIVHDALVHASAHDGMRLARAPRVAVAHNDAVAFEDAIGRWRAEGGTGTPWIAVESLYGMDGDRAPLAELAAVAARHEAMLLIDEAHATGVFGSAGRGLAEGLRCLAEEPERQARLWTLVAAAERALGFASGSQLFPVIVGADGAAVALAERCQAAGYDVRAIRPPTVPAGTARLRISITCNVDEAAIEGLGAVLR